MELCNMPHALLIQTYRFSAKPASICLICAWQRFKCSYGFIHSIGGWEMAQNSSSFVTLFPIPCDLLLSWLVSRCYTLPVLWRKVLCKHLGLASWKWQDSGSFSIRVFYSQQHSSLLGTVRYDPNDTASLRGESFAGTACLYSQSRALKLGVAPWSELRTGSGVRV